MPKVLVVDDIAVNRELVATILESEEHQVFEATDGAEALALVRSERPQLVISDVLMPTMDGYEFVRALRADPAVAATEVIFYTAHYREREARNLAAACGVRQVLVKPCDPQDILAAVRRALGDAGPVTPSAVTEAFDREHLRVLTDKLAQKANELERANERLAALTELNVQLASELDAQVLLGRVCRGARDLIGARYGVLTVGEKNDGASGFFTVSGIDLSRMASLERPAVNNPVFAQVAANRVRRFNNLAGDPTRVGLPPGYPPPKSAVMVPVASLTYVYGWVCLVDKVGGDEFTEEDEWLLSILGAQTGRIYENGNLYGELRRHAEELQLESAERMRAVERLQESEQRFRELAENIHEVFFLLGVPDNRVLYISPAYELTWGRSRASLYAQPQTWLEAIHPDDRPHVQAAYERTRATGDLDLEYRIVRPDGTLRWIHARGFPIRDGNGAICRMAGLAEDVTERHVADQRIRRLNRVYAVLSGINALIVRVRARDELFWEACHIAAEQGAFPLAWVGRLDPGTSGVETVACDGDAAELSDFLIRLNAGAHPGHVELTARAIGSGHAVVANDLAHDAHPAEVLERGLRAAASLPLIADGVPVAAMTLYASERGFFDDEEMRLLEELAGDVSFALGHIAKTERLDYLAYYDALTDLANPALFQERLAQRVGAAAHSSRRLAVVSADIERFQAINDTHGRHVGDRVLREVARRLTACVGDASELGRMGSDQFAIIVTDAENEGAVLRIIDGWWRACFGAPFQLTHDEMRISARAGIALYPNDGTDAAALLTAAEAARNRARKGGARYLFYTQQMGERVAEKLALETQLRRALQSRELVLHYQPKVDLDSRRIVAVEALMRWASPQLGLVLPDRFIALLEETGLIVEAGAWAVRQAIADRETWMQDVPDPPPIAVNVSAVQLRETDFVASVAALFEARGQPLGVDFELTESVLMENAAATIDKLAALRALGVGIAIDDFGTGYSSLAYLARLPVEILKIDRSFVAVMLDDPASMTLVQTMISLAHSLKLKVVAEGVESEDQARILRLLRCDQAQGFLYGRPIPAAEMQALLVEAHG